MWKTHSKHMSVQILFNTIHRFLFARFVYFIFFLGVPFGLLCFVCVFSPFKSNQYAHFFNEGIFPVDSPALFWVSINFCFWLLVYISLPSNCLFYLLIFCRTLFYFVLLVHILAMFFTIIKPGKSLVTNITRIRFFSCVFPHVDSQIGSLCKRYVANFTMMWFYSFMYSLDVCFQCALFNKSFSTFITEEIFGSCVDSLVICQFMFVRKTLVANVTSVKN